MEFFVAVVVCLVVVLAIQVYNYSANHSKKE
jgi:hypothetical protein